MKPIEFCNTHNVCERGRTFAMKFQTMSDVWNACERPDWMLWILEKHSPLTKEQAVCLAIAFAESVLSNDPEGENHPAEAIQAAKDWLANPCDETLFAAARAALRAARSAARSAWSTMQKEQCGIIRSIIPNPFHP